MLPGAVSHLVNLGCCLGAVGATLTAAPPPVDDIIHRVPPPPDILCMEGFQGLHGFTDLDAAKRDCYTALGWIRNDLVRLKKASFRAVRDRETGKPLRLNKTVDNSSFFRLGSGFAYPGTVPSCLIEFNRVSNEQDRAPVFPTGKFDTTVYFYFWERALDVARQILGKCFDDTIADRVGREEDFRIIGYAHSRITGNDWFYPYRVIVTHMSLENRGRLASLAQATRSDSQVPQHERQASHPDLYAAQPDSQAARPASQNPQLDPQASSPYSQVSQHQGRLRQACRWISNSLLCAKNLPRHTA
jgi:hypothetical protein